MDVGTLYMIDGAIWRVCCIDADGAELHKPNTWRTLHMSPEEWRTFTELNKPIGRCD